MSKKIKVQQAEKILFGAIASSALVGISTNIKHVKADRLPTSQSAPANQANKVDSDSAITEQAENTQSPTTAPTENNQEVQTETDTPVSSPTQSVQTVNWNGIDDVTYDDVSKTLTIPGSSKTITNPGRIRGNLGTIDATKIQTINITGPIKLSGSIKGLFSELDNLTAINGLEKLDTSDVSDMSFLFDHDVNLTSLNLGQLNTANVTNMDHMFSMCQKLTSLDVSQLNTAKVTVMNSMFYDCQALTSLTLTATNGSTKFDTSNVTDMTSMFEKCSNLPRIDLRNFNTSSVKSMQHLFYLCAKLPSLDLSKFNTANVTNMAGLFSKCYSLTKLDLSSFDTKNVTDMSHLVSVCDNLTDITFGNNFKTTNVTNMNSMFYHLQNMKELDLSSFDTSKVTDMAYMFQSTKLTKINLSSFDTSKVTNMKWMFYQSNALKELDIHNFDMSAVTNSDKMLEDLDSLDILVLGNKNNIKDAKLNTPGKWVNVGHGTHNNDDNPEASKNWSSGELTTNYNPATDADRYIHFTKKPETPVAPSTPNVPEPSKAANVTVHYQNKDGKTLSPDEILSGNIGDGYISNTKEIPGYVLMERPNNATGFFGSNPQDVTYVYQKAGQIGTGNENENVVPAKSNSKTGTTNKASQKKAAISGHYAQQTDPQKDQASSVSTASSKESTLPQTGNNKTEKTSLFGLGLLAILGSLTSSWFTRKRKEN
ncbi:BspA family leucine-rich repeat surface protein [Lactobacillus sp.]|uniref:BspA family leucine-rich repeat surface protein n=1 Tax=Lactobacillus sp. TaxID=1591 RepID=UPI00258766BC|nr:BspA family leucine-rich repeat surface protein [Lactobacillus sp.]MCO6529930.1 BspA family leucine-rich repeat surface protein [Lactobacillus sp.]